jgi:hypothetical protein
VSSLDIRARLLLPKVAATANHPWTANKFRNNAGPGYWLSLWRCAEQRCQLKHSIVIQPGVSCEALLFMD